MRDNIPTIARVRDGIRNIAQRPVILSKVLLFRFSNLQVCLESPEQGEEVGANIRVRGWVLSKDALAVKGKISINNRIISSIGCKYARPDVIEAFGFSGVSDLIGFDEVVSINDVEVGDGVELSLTFNDSKQSMSVGPVVLRKKIFPSNDMKCLRVRVESPRNEQEFAQDICVQGWALGEDGGAVVGRILINDVQIQEFDLDESRPDVVQAYGVDVGHDRVGFNVKVPWQKVASGKQEAQVVVECAYGNQVSSVGPLVVRKADSALLSHGRGNFKEVWNGEAKDHKSARLAVAGIGDFDEFMETGECSAKTIKEALEITPTDVVLEIGCGTGRIGKALASSCKTWIGTDISGNMLEYAQSNLQDVPNVSLVELSGAGLKEIPSESVDKLYCSVVFMHLEEWDRYRYVEEAFRVLRPGGMCYIDNLNVAGDEGWKVFSELAKLDPATRLPQISKSSTREELEVYMTRAGFCGLKNRVEPLLVTVWGKKP